MAKNKMFRAYAFDIDNNLRSLDTKMIMRKLNGEVEEISTEEFAKVKKDLKGYGYQSIDFSEACINFRKENDDLFIEQMLKSKSAPSWFDFVECVNNASLLAWITARGHSREAFKMAFKKMIMSNFHGLDYKSVVRNQRAYMSILDIDNLQMTDEDVIDYYISVCKFYGMENKETSLEVLGVSECHDPRTFKPKAFSMFCDYVAEEFAKVLSNVSEENKQILLEYGMHVGFSDDDSETVNIIVSNLSKEVKKNIDLSIHIYDTLYEKKKILKI